MTTACFPFGLAVATGLAAMAVHSHWLMLAAGLLLLSLALGFWWSPGRHLRFVRLVSAVLCLLALPPLGLSAYQLVGFYGPRPEPVRQTLFQGVEYIREVVDEPRAVVHIIRVDLSAEGVEVLVTPLDAPDTELPFRARRTSDFLREFGTQVAINAGHFQPFSRKPWAPYPLPGDPVGVHGASFSRGVGSADGWLQSPVLSIGPDNRAAILEGSSASLYNAVTGTKRYRLDGGISGSAGEFAVGPRTAVAVDETGTVLLLVVVDGDQVRYSEGLGWAVLRPILRRHGAHVALNLDGGGSSTLVVEGPNGRPEVLNRPVNYRIPGLERPVATHIGIYARPLPSGGAVATERRDGTAEGM